jgi:5-methylcytosine-specific restriction endonuclease McrA
MVLTRREFKSGNVTRRSYQEQCLVCGASSSMIKQDTLSVQQIREAIPFDETLRDRYAQTRQAEFQERQEAAQRAREQEREERRKFYRQVLDSPGWFRISRKAMRRDNYLCQGCLEAKATEVHHLTYERLGKELACDLISLCHQCHQRIEGIEPEDENEGLTEAEIKKIDDIFASMPLDTKNWQAQIDALRNLAWPEETEA